MKSFLHTILLLLITFFSFHIIAQNNYYVCPTGNDSNTGLSPVTAWESIQHAADVLLPGDSVFIKSGIYHEIVIPANSGTPDNYITYIVYPGDTAIIDGSQFANCYLQFADRAIFDIKDGVSYINVIGLYVKNSNATGITARRGATHVNFINNSVVNTQASGISAGYGLPLGRGTNINATGNFLDSCALFTREVISFRSVDTFEISNNVVINSPQLGIDAKSGCSNGLIFNNFVTDAWPGIYIDAGFIDPAYGSQHNIHVFNNKMYNSRIGIAVSSENGNLGEDIWIYNNIIYDSPDFTLSRDGIDVAFWEQGGPLKNIYIINNTIYGKKRRGIYISSYMVANIIIRNNICSQNAMGQIVVNPDPIATNIIAENNLIDGYSPFLGQNTVFGNPEFIDAASGNFRLLPHSPAINSGSPIDAPHFDYDYISRPQGQGFDIGAFEYSPSLSVDAIYSESNIAVYPNPFTCEINILGIDDKKTMDYKLIDMFGKVVCAGSFSDNIKINSSKYPPGIYILIIIDNDKLIELEKIIKH